MKEGFKMRRDKNGVTVKIGDFLIIDGRIAVVEEYTFEDQTKSTPHYEFVEFDNVGNINYLEHYNAWDFYKDEEIQVITKEKAMNFMTFSVS